MKLDDVSFAQPDLPLHFPAWEGLCDAGQPVATAATTDSLYGI
jgi:hypothetical protein